MHSTAVIIVKISQGKMKKFCQVTRMMQNESDCSFIRISKLLRATTLKILISANLQCLLLMKCLLNISTTANKRMVSLPHQLWVA